MVSVAKKGPRSKKVEREETDVQLMAVDEQCLEEGNSDPVFNITDSEEMEKTWSLAEFRRRYIVIQHKYCELQKKFVQKVKTTSEKHCEGVNRVAQEMKHVVNKLKKDVSILCKAKEKEIEDVKKESEMEMEDLRKQLEEARHVIVQYESKSRSKGPSSSYQQGTEASVMIRQTSEEDNHEVGALVGTLGPRVLSLSIHAQEKKDDEEMEVDEVIPEQREIIDLSNIERSNSLVNERSSLASLQNWAFINQATENLWNEWNYDLDQIKSVPPRPKIMGSIQERASWGVDLCPERRYVRFDGNVEVSLQATKTPVRGPPPKSLISGQSATPPGSVRSQQLTYSVKKSPIKSRASGVVAQGGDLLKSIHASITSRESYQSVNLGILPDLAPIGFKCHLLSENEALYQHVLTKDAFSLLCENFQTESSAEIGYKAIKSHKLIHYLPDYLKGEIMFEKSEIHTFARILGESVLCSLEK